MKFFCCDTVRICGKWFGGHNDYLIALPKWKIFVLAVILGIHRANSGKDSTYGEGCWKVSAWKRFIAGSILRVKQQKNEDVWMWSRYQD